ncbi:MAG TPA: DHA2 family efflux MFS transporter permease subunit [Ktedonobacteraceae bacterium]|nr:DHA2 family efflux MFS transporter permease subunit [Ktedonobacteraceae bacterium]
MTHLGNRRWWALGALTLAVLAVGLDGTILSVALPTLAGALHASESDLQWFTSGYLLVLAAAMLPAGLLGDRYGRKKVMLTALALFAVGSAACAYAPSASAFIAARVILGIAGAGIVVMALSALTVLFTEEERPRAVGIWAAANFLSLPIGPILGGWLLTNFWWGWVFLMNVPVALLGLIIALVLVPESRAPVRPRLDPIGIITSTSGLVGVTYGLIEAGQNGWTDATALVLMIAGVVVLVGFFFWERWLGRRPGGQPLVDPALFRSPSFTWGVILAAIAGLSMIGVLFTMPQYFQGILGTDAMGSGIRLLPLIGGLVVGAVSAERVARLVGAKITVALGFVLLAAGMLLGATTGVATGESFSAVWMALVGAGMGLTMATAASAALSELPQERSGVGSAVMQALQKVGAPFGAAILGSVLSTTYQGQLNLAGLAPVITGAVKASLFGGLAVAQKLGSAALFASVRAAFVHGMDVSLVVAAGIAAMGFVLTLAFLPAHATPRVSEVPAMEAGASVTPTGPLLVGAVHEDAPADQREEGPDNAARE